MVEYAFWDSPIGCLQIGTEEDAVVSLSLCQNYEVSEMPSLLVDTVKSQLREYFAGERAVFTFPIALKGTPFQTAVWQALLEIPYGHTRTYGQIAAAVGNPKASRAVGMANNRNPLCIIVPCHRVIGSNHSLTGYAYGLPMKQYLLSLEAEHRDQLI